MIISEFRGEYRFLSNFYPHEVRLDGERYPSNEHAYQAAKTNIEAEREAIRNTPTPGEAKRLGRKGTLRSDWERVKVDVMANLILQKFQANNMRKLLLNTGDAILIEGNTWGDQVWGTCNGYGENKLGRILMATREYYKKIADIC